MTKDPIRNKLEKALFNAYKASLTIRDNGYISLFVTPNGATYRKFTKTKNASPRKHEHKLIHQFASHCYGVFPNDDNDVIETINATFKHNEDIVAKFHNVIAQFVDKHTGVMTAFALLYDQYPCKMTELERWLLDDELQSFKECIDEDFGNIVDKLTDWIYENQERSITDG